MILITIVQVRHISGQHVKEFKDFLARYPEEFVVKEEIVFLKEYEGKITSTFREPEEHRIDPVVTNQFIQFFRETVDARGPLHVDQLFELVSNHFNIDLWSTLFKTPQDLLTFLKIYSHLFHVQASIITLVPQKPYTTNQPAVRPMINQSQPSNHLIGQTINQSATPQPINQNLVQRREIREGGESPRLSSSPNGSSSPRDSPVSLNQQTLKQRVNMVVMRMIAQNSDHDQRVSPREETGGRGEPRPAGPGGHGPYQPPHMQAGGQGNGESREAVKQRVLGVSRVVVSAREAAAIVEELLRAGQPVGFDGEGVNLGPKGQLTLVQISTVGGQVVIIVIIMI